MSKMRKLFNSADKIKTKISRRNFQTLNEEEENILEKNLVWIFSNPRSGTTWLGTQLLSHNTLSMDEPLIGQHIGINVGAIKSRYERNMDFFKDREDYFFSEKYRPVWTKFLRKLILNRIHAQFNDLSHKIIIKEPNGSIAADVISESLPMSKILVLFRDGRDMIDSKFDALKEGSWGAKQGLTPIAEKNKIGFIKFHSDLWVKTIILLEETYEKHDEKLRYKVKYESLRSETFSNLKKIYEFLDISIDTKKLQDIVNRYAFENIKTKGEDKPVRTASPGKWREKFSKEEQELMNNIMFDVLQRLGY